MHGNGRVPMFRMKPNYGFLVAAAISLLFGVMVYWSGHLDPGAIDAAARSNLGLALSIVIAGACLILGTGRMWFRHLWHDRYDRHGKMRDSGRPRAKEYR